MPDPTRQTHATEHTGDDSQGALDPTLARPDGAPDPLARAAGPQFAPPAHAGELGTFGRYRVLQKLGQGGMGAVYLAYDSTLERKVALKVMLGGSAADPEARERFLREARAVAKVKSDHVVTIFDVGEQDGTPFIAMEYLLGLPLDRYLRQKGELPLAQVLRVCEETARGLAAVHELGLIHRDIKPGNLWLEAPHGRVKLLDFGLARVEGEDTHLTGTGTVMGTPAFMSPEQGRGKKLDPRSDLFTLGVLLYRLCTGKMPFVGDTTMAILTALAVDTPTAPRLLRPDLPEALEAVIVKLLQKNPADRYQSAAEVARALYGVAAGPLPVVVALPVPAFAVAAQTQNVWESIDDDSRSAAVPLATPAATEVDDDPPPAPRPARRKPERAVSKTPIYLAAAGLLVACAVLAVVLWPKKKPVEEAKEPDKPSAPGKKDPPKPPPVVPATGDRKIAEFILNKGGGVFFNTANGLGRAGNVAELPAGPLEVTGVELFGKQWVSEDMERVRGLRALTRLKIHDTNVGESGLKAFEGTTQLTELHIELSPITDLSLANFAGCKNLQVLSLFATGIGNAGIGHFAGCKSLTHLSVSDTNVDDEGLKALADNPNLLGLTVGGTKITGATLERFAANPKLQILSASAVRLTDTDLAHLTKCRDLWHLVVSVNDIGDGGLAHLVGLPLSYLDLRGTKVSDAGLVHLEKLSKLTDLYLSGKDVSVSETRVKELAAKLPACRIEWNGGTIAPPDPNRTAADQFRKLGATVTISSTAGTVRLKPSDPLPKDPFTLIGLSVTDHPVTAADAALLKRCAELKELELIRAKLPDVALSHLADLKTLQNVILSGNPITDDGLAHLKGIGLRHLAVDGTGVTDSGLAALTSPGGFQLNDLFQLWANDTRIGDATLERLGKPGPQKHIGLARTAVTDAGMKHLAGVAALDFDLSGTGITDTGLAHLEQLGGIKTLNLTGTKVSAPGVKRLQTKFPQCQVKWQPAAVVPAGTDRAAAEAVLALGGQVRAAAMSAKETITDPKQLPPGPFVLGYVFIETKDQVPAALDAALAACAACKDLHTVVLNGPLVTNDMVARFKDCPKLNRLTVHRTPVTGAGLTPFKAHLALRVVSLEKADIGDEVLDALSANPELTFLDVRGTRVSAAKVAEFAKAAPKCRVSWPGGVIEPVKK
ncbi:MAG: hypothetical protein FJ304_22135 [Planctomycetes bacterium]|nr:hypothetical protein [Planctomycetota bacterium]